MFVVYIGTRVAGVPVWLADVWRAANFAIAFTLVVYWVGMVSSTLRGEGRMPRFSAWGMAALLVFTLRAVVVQAERWSTPMVWEGAPSLSIALAFGLANAVALRRQVDRFRRSGAVSSMPGATRSQEGRRWRRSRSSEGHSTG